MTMNETVAIIGAGNVGATLAQRLITQDIADVVLVDILEGRPQGIALDLMQARSWEGHDRQIVGSNDMDAIAGAAIVVITAGLPRQPGMSRDDLLLTNAKIIVEVTQQAIARCPDALLIMVTNPLDVMTDVAWRVSGLPPERVMGMAGILDSARFQTFLAEALGVAAPDIQAMVLGGHGDLMVPLVRYSTVRGIPLAAWLDDIAIAQIIDRTRNGGTEVVNLLKTGGAYYAPAAALAVMVKAILNDTPRIVPVSAYLNGQYYLHDLFMGVPCQLGREGIARVVELDLTEAETQALHQSATAVRQTRDRLQDWFATIGIPGFNGQ